MSEEKASNKLLEGLVSITTVENIQKYVLGYKKNGQGRAVYDIIKDYTVKPKKKKGKNKRDPGNTHSLYLSIKKNKKKKKKDKYWHI